MHAVREYSRVVVYLHPFLDLALDEGEWSTLHLHLSWVLQVPIQQVCWDSKPVWMLWQWRKVPSARNQTVVPQFLSMQPRKYANCTFLISIFGWYDTMQSWWAGVTPIVSCADWYLLMSGTSLPFVVWQCFQSFCKLSGNMWILCCYCPQDMLIWCMVCWCSILPRTF